MTEIESFATTLQQYSTAIRTISDPDELRNYAVDGMLPRFAIIPETVEQVSQAVALANQQGLTLITRGGGSRLNLGGIPERFALCGRDRAWCLAVGFGRDAPDSKLARARSEIELRGHR